MLLLARGMRYGAPEACRVMGHGEHEPAGRPRAELRKRLGGRMPSK